MIKHNAKVLSNVNLKEKIFEMKLEFNNKINAMAGQFVNISTMNSSMLLKRPISISKINNNVLTITYRVVGEGTKAISNFKIGDYVEVLAPLGNGFKIVENKTCLLIGGGIGIPPLVELQDRLLEKGNKVITVLASRSEDLLIYEEKFKNLFITTDDGSKGFKGNVIEFLKQSNIEFDTLYACGPSRMLQGLDNMYFGKKEGYISFEERMACGIGACYGCICKTKTVENGYMRVCKEGPVFELGVVKYES